MSRLHRLPILIGPILLLVLSACGGGGSSDAIVAATPISRVSMASDGTEANGYRSAPSLSANGRYVAFSSYASNLVAGNTNARTDAFVHDTRTGTTTRVSVTSDGTEANSGNSTPSLSADGRYVAFASAATNLVAGDTNGLLDSFRAPNP